MVKFVSLNRPVLWLTYGMDIALRGATVSEASVEQAILAFDESYRDRAEYENWLENKKYKYAIAHLGRLYPPKALLSIATGLPLSDFNGGVESNRIFQQLGYQVLSLRNPAWVRDELILALDLYFQFVPRIPHKDQREVVELSDLLRSLPIHSVRHWRSNFRNPAGVAMKLGNLQSLDPDADRAGLSSVSRLDKAVWQEFTGDRDRLRSTAEAIRKNRRELNQDLDRVEALENESFPEGRILTRLHTQRERNPALTRKKKAQVLSLTGRLACEVCAFDFVMVYGHLGEGFAECHHIKPLSTLEPGSRTRLEDLAIVCANCHRMLHRGNPWATVSELKQVVNTNSSVTTL